jgi:hypothetical protein
MCVNEIRETASQTDNNLSNIVDFAIVYKECLFSKGDYNKWRFKHFST